MKHTNHQTETAFDPQAVLKKVTGIIVNSQILYSEIKMVSEACPFLARAFETEDIGAIVASATSAMFMAQSTGRHLGRLNGVEMLPAIPALYSDGFFVINKSHHPDIRAKNVLIVENIVAAGGMTGRLIEAVRGIGGRIAGVAALCNLGGVTPADLDDIPKLVALTNMKLEAAS